MDDPPTSRCATGKKPAAGEPEAHHMGQFVRFDKPSRRRRGAGPGGGETVEFQAFAGRRGTVATVNLAISAQTATTRNTMAG